MWALLCSSPSTGSESFEAPCNMKTVAVPQQAVNGDKISSRLLSCKVHSSRVGSSLKRLIFSRTGTQPTCTPSRPGVRSLTAKINGVHTRCLADKQNHQDILKKMAETTPARRSVG